MKKYNIYYLILIAIFYTGILFGNIPEGKVFFIASNSLLPQDLIDGFQIGVEAGMKYSLGEKRYKELFYKLVDTNSNKMAVKSLVKKAIKNGAIAIVGIPSSHEAVLVAPVCKKHNILCISAGASHTKIGSFGATSLSVLPSMEKQAMQVSCLVDRLYSNKKGVVIIDPKTVYSIKLSMEYTNILKIKKVFLSDNAEFNEQDLKQIRESSYIIYSTYPFNASESIKQLVKNNIIKPTFVNASWDAKLFVLLKKVLSEAGMKVILPAIWVPNSKSSKTLEAELNKIINVSPTTEMASGFDAGLTIGFLINKLGNNLSRQNIINEVKKGFCINNSSVSKLCFNKNGGHAERDFYWGILDSKMIYPKTRKELINMLREKK